VDARLHVERGQDLHFEASGNSVRSTRLLTKGWELLSISSITKWFAGYGLIRVSSRRARERLRGPPDRIGLPDLSSAGQFNPTRDDYFGGPNNASFFAIPIGIAGGTGPNSGRFGTLGRNTFRGPAYYDFDLRSSRRLRLATRKRFGASGSAIRAELFKSV